MKKIILPLILAALFMWTAAASAQTAQEMTKDCTLSSVGKKTLNNMTDGRYTSYWSSSTNRNAYLDIEAPQGQKMGSVYIQFFENAAPFDVQTPDEAGNWQTISTYETGFLAQYVPLEQICLSPQCGFASTEEGNSLSEAQQWDKVRLVTGIAAQVW